MIPKLSFSGAADSAANIQVHTSARILSFPSYLLSPVSQLAEDLVLSQRSSPPLFQMIVPYRDRRHEFKYTAIESIKVKEEILKCILSTEDALGVPCYSFNFKQCSTHLKLPKTQAGHLVLPTCHGKIVLYLKMKLQMRRPLLYETFFLPIHENRNLNK